jgi:hypothetical protein
MKAFSNKKIQFTFILSFAFLLANATHVSIIYTRHSIDSLDFFKKRKMMMLEWSNTFDLPVGDSMYTFQMISKRDDSLLRYNYPIHFLNDTMSMRIPYFKIQEISADSIEVSHTCYAYNNDHNVERIEIAFMQDVKIAKKSLSGFYTKKIPGAMGLLALNLFLLLATYGEAALIVSLF